MSCGCLYVVIYALYMVNALYVGICLGMVFIWGFFVICVGKWRFEAKYIYGYIFWSFELNIYGDIYLYEF